jgi:hypothetical protein
MMRSAFLDKILLIPAIANLKILQRNGKSLINRTLLSLEKFRRFFQKNAIQASSMETKVNL